MRSSLAQLSSESFREGDSHVLAPDPGSDTLLVAFAGIGPHGRPAKFSFLGAVEHLAVSKIFVRDPYRAWYHRGVPGLGGSIDEVAASLRAIAADWGVRRVVMTGTSVGGYASLVFGRLLDADAVLTFVPPTFLGWSMRLRYRNSRYWQDRLRLTLTRRLDRRYADLRRVLDTPDRPPLLADVHYAAGDRIDASYARRLARTPGVTLHPHGVAAGHDIVHRLKTSNELHHLLAALVEGPMRKASSA
jgi:hypothetical protein